VLTGAVLLSGCAGNYVARTQGVRAAYQAEAYDVALNRLEALERGGSEKDRLLLLLDRGMVLHASGRWSESIPVLAEADRLAAELDVVSVSEEAGTLLTNERERAYRGEDFERLMVSVLQALNYTQLGQEEAALVEVRRVNQKLERMIAEEKKPYEQLAIARYIGGVLYEDQREWDSAYIDYMKALELEPTLGPLAEPLLRLAKKTGRLDEYERLRQRFPDVAHEPLGPGEGHLVVVLEAGLSPVKEPMSRRMSTRDVIQVPVYRDRGHPARARVWVGEGALGTVRVTSLADVARVHLNDRVGRMLLKQMAGAAVKTGVAAGMATMTRNRGVGALTFMMLNATNQADLRSWLSLPAEFQLARFRLPAGRHQLRVESAGRWLTREVEVKPGRVQVVVVRGYH
jgi:uncharacterized protein